MYSLSAFLSNHFKNRNLRNLIYIDDKRLRLIQLRNQKLIFFGKFKTFTLVSRHFQGHLKA